MTTRALAAVVSLVGAAACIAPGTGAIATNGGADDDGAALGGGGQTATGGQGASGTGAPPSTQGAKVYAQDVHADLLAGCGTCHADGAVGAPVFMDADPNVSYVMMEGWPNALIAHPANSLLVLKGEHAGPALDGPGTPGGLLGAVQSWLALEAEERGLVVDDGGEPDPVGPTFDEAMGAFADCMTLSDWEGAGLGLLPAQQTQGWGPCQGCHNTGVGGLFLSASTQQTYDETKKSKFRLQKYVAPVFDENGGFEGLTIADRLQAKGTEQCPFQDPQDCHPKYLLDPAAAQAIDSFVNQVVGRLANGQCASP